MGLEIQADFHDEIGIPPQRPVEVDVHRGEIVCCELISFPSGARRR